MAKILPIQAEMIQTNLDIAKRLLQHAKEHTIDLSGDELIYLFMYLIQAQQLMLSALSEKT